MIIVRPKLDASKITETNLSRAQASFSLSSWMLEENKCGKLLVAATQSRGGSINFISQVLCRKNFASKSSC